jgi:hypothetical protein
MGLKNNRQNNRRNNTLSCGLVRGVGSAGRLGVPVSPRFAWAGPIALQWDGPFARLLVWPVDGAPERPGVIHNWGQG